MGEYIIKYNDVEIKVNPIIFSENSDLFKNYYDPDQVMTISGERSAEEFQQLLPFVQGKDPDITLDNYAELESFADEWIIPSLKDKLDLWEKNHQVDILLNNFLKNCHEKDIASELLPKLADSINELFQNPNFFNIQQNHLQKILSIALKKEVVRDHHALFNFLINFISKDKIGRINLLNFINANHLNQNEVEVFFESHFIPDDSTLLLQIQPFLVNLSIYLKKLYTDRQERSSKIGSEINKQNSLIDKKNKELQSFKDQLKQKQTSSNPKKQRGGPSRPNSSFQYSPSKSKSDTRNDSKQKSQNTNTHNKPQQSNLSVVEMNGEIPAEFRTDPQSQMAAKPLSAIEIQQLMTERQQCIYQLNYLSQCQVNSSVCQQTKDLTERLNQIQLALSQNQSQLQQQPNQRFNNSQQMYYSSSLGAPVSSLPKQKTSNAQQLQVEKLVPNISVQKPTTKRTTLDPEQKAFLEAEKKKIPVKIEKPSKSDKIEFEKT